MKLIEYKPMGRLLIMDVQNIPEDIKKNLLQAFKRQPLTFISPIHKPTVHEINPNNKWVHPDYVVKEIDPVSNDELISLRKKSYKNHIDSYQTFDGEIKEKTFSELIEIIKEAGPMPDSMKGNSFENLYWNGYDPLDDVTPEIWEIAKPKFNPKLAKKYKAPIIFGTIGGDPVRITHPLSNQALLKDMQYAHEFYMQKAWEETGINEIRWFATSFEQEYEWTERKKKCPLLTVEDLKWVDSMVDEVFKKHTCN